MKPETADGIRSLFKPIDTVVGARHPDLRPTAPDRSTHGQDGGRTRTRAMSTR